MEKRLCSTSIVTTMKLNDIEIFQMPALELAPYLLGKLLCVSDDERGVLKVRITETEAYYGEEDTACHAHRGKTPRTEVLYERGGIAYVYLCYGIHCLMNVISGPEDHPEGVLIRGVDGYNGPGKLTKFLGIDRSFNRESLLTSDRIWIEDDGFIPVEIFTSPRIGIDYATKEYIDKPWRFYLK